LYREITAGFSATLRQLPPRYATSRGASQEPAAADAVDAAALAMLRRAYAAHIDAELKSARPARRFTAPRLRRAA